MPELNILDRLAADARALPMVEAEGEPQGDRGGLGDSPVLAPKTDGRHAGDFGRLLGDSPRYQSPEYPVDALGPLQDAARAIAEGGQIDIAMAGQTVLAAAALLAQGVRNVRTLAGIKPLSLYFQTIAESGDGKSTAEGVALRRISDLEREAHGLFVADLARRDSKDDRPPPRSPYRVMKDATAQGIWRAFKDGQPALGSFTAEGAAMLCGWGMSAEHRAHTAGALNDLWDGGAVSLSRGTDGRTQLYGRRLAVHWLLQPAPARGALHDPLLENIGFWPRFLIAWPAPLAPRKARQWHPENDVAIRAFWDRCGELFKEPLPDGCSDLPVIEADEDALALACRSFEALEQAARSAGGKLVDVRAFAVRATEQAFRVAGVLAAFDGRETMDAGTMRGAVQLVMYSLETWQGIFGQREEAEAIEWARAMYAWMLKKGGRVSEQAVLHTGPKSLRSRQRRDTALALLEGAGLIRRALDYTANGGERLVPGVWEVLNVAVR